LRIGPDLANLGLRQTHQSRLLQFLFQPRLVHKESAMPPHAFLFQDRRVGRHPSPDALALPQESAPRPSCEVVPSLEAKALAAYLVSLQSEIPLYEAPWPAQVIAAEARQVSVPTNSSLGARSGGRFHPLVYEPYRSTNDLERLRPRIDPAALLLARGKATYLQNCAPCHGDAGEGDPAKQTPPLAGSEWVLAPAPSRLIRIVLHGLQGSLVVQGQTYGGAAMIPWRDLMTDEQIAATLTYLRQSWGHSASTLEPAAVKAVREATRGRTDHWTQAELLEVPDAE
jgi:nitrite reductase (NO-forming)